MDQNIKQSKVRGAVWSLADARIISENPDFSAEERPEIPEWYAADLEKVSK